MSLFSGYFVLPFSCLILKLLNSSLFSELIPLHLFSQHTAPSVNFLHVCVTTTYHQLQQNMYVCWGILRSWNTSSDDTISLWWPTFVASFRTCANLWGNKNGNLDPFYCLEVIWNSLQEARILSYHIIEEELKGRMKVTGREGIRRKQLLYDSRKIMGYSEFKVEALDCILRRTRFGRGYGLVEDWLENEWTIYCIVFSSLSSSSSCSWRFSRLSCSFILKT